LVEEWNRIRTGEKYFIQYKLELPVLKAYAGTPPLPTVKNVIVNERVFCSGETPREYAELMCAKCMYKHLFLPSD
jgi:enamine deaminase RidA (YjgF/YER057c/UK114 family)